jgi:hypothetical protein
MPPCCRTCQAWCAFSTSLVRTFRAFTPVVFTPHSAADGATNDEAALLLTPTVGLGWDSSIQTDQTYQARGGGELKWPIVALRARVAPNAFAHTTADAAAAGVCAGASVQRIRLHLAPLPAWRAAHGCVPTHPVPRLRCCVPFPSPLV